MLNRHVRMALEASAGAFLAMHLTMYLLAACRHAGIWAFTFPNPLALPWDSLRLSFAIAASATAYLVSASVQRTLTPPRKWVLSLALGIMLGMFASFTIVRHFAWWQEGAELPEIPWTPWLSWSSPLRAAILSVPVFILWQTIYLRRWCQVPEESRTATGA